MLRELLDHVSDDDCWKKAEERLLTFLTSQVLSEARLSPRDYLCFLASGRADDDLCKYMFECITHRGSTGGALHWLSSFLPSTPPQQDCAILSGQSELGSFRLCLPLRG